MQLPSPNTILLKIIKAGIYASLLTPLVFWDQVIYPFVFPKVIFFRIIVEVIFILYIALVVLEPRYSPKVTPLALIIFLYISIALSTSLLGENVYRSFWSVIMRGEGIITLIHLGMFFVVLSSVITQKDEWRNIFKFLVVIFFIENALAFSQVLKLPFVKMFGSTRPNGTFGNPAYYAMFALLNIWLCFYFILDAVIKKIKIFSRDGVFAALACVSIFLGIISLYKTENRGGTLALACGLALFFTLYSFSHPNHALRKYFTRIIFFLGCVVFLIFIISPQNSIVKKLLYYPKNDITIQNRIISWDIGWKAFVQKPFLGYGNENFSNVFDRYFNSDIVRDSGSFTWYDRAHNTVIEILVANGLFGLLAYLAIFAFACIEIAKTSLPKIQKIALASLLFSYFVNDFFLFDTLSSLLLFFIILSFIQSLNIERNSSFFQNISIKIHSIFSRTKKLQKSHIVSLCVAFAIMVYFINIAPISAAYFASRVFLKKDIPNHEIAKNFQKAFFITSPQAPEFRQALGGYVYNALSENPQIDPLAELIILAIKELEKSNEANPLDAQTRLIEADLAQLASPANPTLLDLAEKRALEALAISPKRYQPYFTLGKIKFSQKKFDGAKMYFSQVLEINKNFIPARWNLAILYILTEQYENAEKEISSIRSKDIDFIYKNSNIHLLSGAFIEKKKYARAIRLYKEALALYPKSSLYYEKLSELYKLAGNPQEAQNMLNKALEIQ